MNHDFMDALEQVEREKGISKEILLDAIETALASAYKRDQKVAQSIEVRIDPDTGAFHVYTHKTVVEEVEDDKNEINLADAAKINPIYELGDLVEFEIFPKEFGRIAAQTAKQVVVQRIREAERGIIYDEFVNRVGDLITGVIQRFEQRNLYIDLGKIEGVLPSNEQLPNERYEQGMRLKTFIVEVKKTTKGPQVLLSRTRTGLLKRLLELEVPEIQDGIVEIKSVAREPGYRSKVAVYSRDQQIDPVGACVGSRGIRIQMIVRELKGEKIDVVPWNLNPIEYIINALSPAKVSDVKILPSKKTAIVIVPDFQLSLAIGKEGQNARLAAKLTGWKIDIKSESQASERMEEIEQLVREELGFRDIIPEAAKEKPLAVKTDEVEQVTESKVSRDEEPDEKEQTQDEGNEAEYTEEYEEGEQYEKEAETEAEVEAEVEAEAEGVLRVAEEEEEVAPKKKTKKLKSAPKHLAKIELDDEPISLEDGYFFSDVLKERKTPQNDEADSVAKTKEKAQDKTKHDSAKTPVEPDAFAGFTIGQMLNQNLTNLGIKEKDEKIEKAGKRSKT